MHTMFEPRLLRSGVAVLRRGTQQHAEQADQFDRLCPGLLERHVGGTFAAQNVLETANLGFGQAETVASFEIASMIVHEGSMPRSRRES